MARWFHCKIKGYPSRFDMECMEFAMRRIGPRSMWLTEDRDDSIEVRVRLPPALVLYPTIVTDA